jgi:dipeptidyl aminopeptidase/acylaminoacyl peptidase
MGFSAGGHLVCLLGLTGPDNGFEGKLFPKQSSRVKCVVDYFGPTDLSAYGNDETAQNSVFEPMLGGRFKDKPELYKKASPLTYVHKDAPPFLIIHGTKDHLVPYNQSVQLEDKLKQVGGKVKLVTVEGADHGFFGEDQRRTTRETLKFLEENLKK